MAAKRPVAADGPRDAEGKKQKIAGSTLLPTADSSRDHELLKFVEETSHHEEDNSPRVFYASIRLPDERQELVDELHTGSHILELEYNEVTSAKCRARNFVVRKTPGQKDNRIFGPFRFSRNPRSSSPVAIGEASPPLSAE